MSLFFKTHFPQTKDKWIKYTMVFFPVVFSAMLFSLNGIVDNFMVGKINQGVASLGAANSWTQILYGLYWGTAISGSIILTQFYHAKDYDRVKQVSRLRIMLSIMFCIPFVLLAWVTPESLTSLFLKPSANASAADIANNKMAIAQSVDYIRIIALQWILAAITLSLGGMISEIGHVKVTLAATVVTIITNITINAWFIYGLSLGVKGAAWASVISRFVELAICIGYILWKKLEFGFNPLTLFKSSKEMYKIFWKRWFNFFSVATVTAFIIFRNYFYDVGYPVGGLNGNLAVGVSGMGIIGLSGAMSAMFMSTFSALGVMSANFVASHLGKGEVEKAKQNANEIKGYNTLMALGMSIILALLAFLIPFMSFMSSNIYDEFGNLIFDGKANLLQVRNEIWVICFYYPTWIWFCSSLRNMVAGGKGQMGNFIDWMVNGPIQILFIWIEMYFIVQNWPFMQANFWVAEALFLTTDFIKLIGIEIYYYRTDWAHSIVKEETQDIVGGITNIEEKNLGVSVETIIKTTDSMKIE